MRGQVCVTHLFEARGWGAGADFSRHVKVEVGEGNGVAINQGAVEKKVAKAHACSRLGRA